jgi:hypothetical protein
MTWLFREMPDFSLQKDKNKSLQIRVAWIKNLHYYRRVVVPRNTVGFRNTTVGLWQYDRVSTVQRLQLCTMQICTAPERNARNSIKAQLRAPIRPRSWVLAREHFGHTGDEKYPIWKAILVCWLDKSKNVLKSFSAFIVLRKYQCAFQIDANGPAGLLNWCSNTYKNSI